MNENQIKMFIASLDLDMQEYERYSKCWRASCPTCRWWRQASASRSAFGSVWNGL